jgi:SIR2-like protein
MPNGLTDADWSTLLQRIVDKECTPFVGAGASAEKVPVASELALAWASEYEYPLADATNLARVAQFLAVEQDPIFPKQLLRRQLQQLDPPDFTAPDEPHGVLADLDLPIYLTTNYDGLMLAALKARGKKPRRELCGWNDLVRETEPSLLDAGFAPTAAAPLVYYLHGQYELPQSMVLTEDDYLAFLVRISTDNTVRLLPSKIRSALATTSLLFVGYSLSDWDFRVLFRGLMGSLGSTLGMTSIAVQLDPSSADEPEERRRHAQTYLNSYFEKIQTIKVRLFWGDVRDFSRELRQRLEDFRASG